MNNHRNLAELEGSFSYHDKIERMDFGFLVDVERASGARGAWYQVGL